jgi:serine/threonine-protein kinase
MTDPRAIGCGTILAERYELVTELARGATGDVFEARDRVDGSKAAVKVLRAEYLADDSMRRRFRREGAVLKALDHPAIVRLLELGVDDSGTVFLVTEYVEGETLQERLSDGPIRIDEADALVDTLCGGLGAAHDHGVFHGDLKPANVVWPSTKQPRLVDFGASKILGLDRLTATGEISGTRGTDRQRQRRRAARRVWARGPALRSTEREAAFSRRSRRAAPDEDRCR